MVRSMASQQVQPKLVIHGGAGGSLQSKGGIEAVRKSLYDVLEAVYPLLKNGASAVDAVVHGCRLLEDDPRFNAGTGSVVQSDGQIRMSATTPIVPTPAGSATTPAIALLKLPLRSSIHSCKRKSVIGS